MRYNEKNIDLSSSPVIRDAEAIEGADITYLTSYHGTRRDFDPEWAKTIRAADVVFHEGLNWDKESRGTLNSVARAAIRYAHALTPDRNSFIRQRFEAIAGTSIRQEYWDASNKDVQEQGLYATTIEQHHDWQQVQYEATDLMKQGDFDASIKKRSEAQAVIFKQDLARDRIGIRRVGEFVAELGDDSKDTKNIVVFMGAAHIYQAITVARAAQSNVTVQSRLHNHLLPIVREYGNYIVDTPDQYVTARSWLSEHMLHQAMDKAGFKSSTDSVNKIDPQIEQMSDDEVASRLSSQFGN